MTTNELMLGDAREVLKTMASASIDAIVTDPPYELSFMGKAWDGTGVAFDVGLWAECLRVLKPGGHLLAFSGSRTSHRMVCAIEDAGFEVRDTLMWLYGSGMPKGQNISKAIDKAAGATREVIGERRKTDAYGVANAVFGGGPDHQSIQQITAPATAEAKAWDGWNTQLKPGYEPICLARKPVVGTIAANVLAYGTGGLNVDASRIDAEDIEALHKNWDRVQSLSAQEGTVAMSGGLKTIDLSDRKPTGRWPANVLLDEDAALALDEQSPGASRFFYTAKASRAERDAGLASLPEGAAGQTYGYGAVEGNSRKPAPCTANRPVRNTHATVKPMALMRYLITLITPPGGVVLDPFMGSGTTGAAAAELGFSFVGIELDADSLATAELRIKHWGKV